MVARRNARDGGGPPRLGPPVRKERRAARPTLRARGWTTHHPRARPPPPTPPRPAGKRPGSSNFPAATPPPIRCRSALGPGPDPTPGNARAHSMPIGSRPRIGPAGTDPRPRRGHVTSHATSDGPEIGAPGRSAGPGQTNAPRAGPARPRDDVRRCFQHASPRLSHRTAVSSSCPKRGALSVPRGAPFRSQERRPSCPK